VCDAASCPNGCCTAAGACEAYASESNTSCGAAGASCAACASGQECNKSNGQCVCDGTSCPTGCCNGTTCTPYSTETPTKCGAGGAACASCANGVCDTTNGTCHCDANTCLNGCCNGGLTGTCSAYGSQNNGACGSGGATCGSCGGGTCTLHQNGLGQQFEDCTPVCNPVGQSGTGTNCTQQGALDACNAYSAVHGGATCTLYTCGPVSTRQYIYMSDTVTSGFCSSWSYYMSSAPFVGQVFENTGTTCDFGCAAYDTGIYWR
jgi:hypothetical protein